MNSIEGSHESLGYSHETLVMIQNLISRADTKSEIILVANAILIGILTITPAELLSTFRELIAGTKFLPDSVEAIVVIISLVCSVISICIALWALRPRLSFEKEDSLLYFGDIAKQPLEQFRTKFEELTPGKIQSEIISQIHANSVIAKHKYACIRISTILFLIALVLWIVKFVIWT